MPQYYATHSPEHMTQHEQTGVNANTHIPHCVFTECTYLFQHHALLLFVAVSILLLSLPQTMYLKANGYPESWDLHDIRENPIMRLLVSSRKMVTFVT